MNFYVARLAQQLGIVSIHIRHCWRMNSFPCNSMFPKQKSMHFRELVVHWVMIADS